MAGLIVCVEGSSAQQAIDALCALEGVRVEVSPPEEATRTDWLSLTANLLQIASAPLLAREIYLWFQRQREREEHFSCVIICPDGERLNLSSATEAEIKAIVQRFGLKDTERA